MASSHIQLGKKSSKNLSRVEKRYIQKKVTVHLHTSDFMTGCYVLLQSFYNEWHYIDGFGTRKSGVLEASLRNGLNTKIETLDISKSVIVISVWK